MRGTVRIAGIGTVCDREGEAGDAAARARRLQVALPHGSAAGRLFHPVEEMTFLAAHDALSHGGVPMPVGMDAIGIALGVEEGIDGIKARYYQGVLRDGLLGASPMAFPLTTPNTIAARISILLDIRGESFTICGGDIAGAQALGVAMRALRDGGAATMLAGGATAIEEEFLAALCQAGRGRDAGPGAGACILLLDRQGPAGNNGRLMGYGEGFGEAGCSDAVRGCLEDAAVAGADIDAVQMASLSDGAAAVRAVRVAGVRAPILRSPSAALCAASFPFAVAEAIGGHPGATVLVVGSDCLAGAAAVVVRGGS